MIADPARNVLVITGSGAARQNVIDLVKVFDVDYLAGQSYELFPVRSGDPDKVATQLQSALQLDPDGPLGGTLKIVPIDEANAIMVIAQQKSYLDRAAELIEQLDAVKQTAGRTAHIYFLKNTQALDLQLLLQRAFNPPAGGATNGEPGSLAPGEQPAALTATPAVGTPNRRQVTVATSSTAKMSSRRQRSCQACGAASSSLVAGFTVARGPAAPRGTRRAGVEE